MNKRKIGKKKLKCKKTYSQFKFLLECLGYGESKSSRSIVGTSTNGSNTSTKKSMLGSRARM
jgi:hypothetical protein